jgi:hypothetical protein
MQAPIPGRHPARFLPSACVVAAVVAMVWYGRVPQLAHYHEFADTRAWMGVPNAADVLSNIPFALVGAWMLAGLWTPSARERLGPAWASYAVFALAILATAFGSGYYHWAPGNARLVWDRLPIALASAGLLGAVHARTHEVPRPALLPALVVVAVGSVAWWSWTDSLGADDLRPYLLLQGALLVVIPLWQWLGGTPRPERFAFWVAIALYAAAKLAEVADVRIFHATEGFMSGHTLKHLLSALASAVIGYAALHISTRAPSSTTRLVGIAK